MFKKLLNFFASLFGKDTPSEAAPTSATSNDDIQIEALPEEQFWGLISETTPFEADPDAQIKKLREVLMALSADDVAAFRIAFDRELKRSYTWDLWGAVYVVHGGCSDDSFDYFRHWLVSKGQTAFETVLKDPDALADLVVENVEGVLEFEEFSYIAGDIWSEKTGRDWAEIPFDVKNSTAGDPAGKEFEEDEEHLAKRYPKLWARFGENPL